MAIQYNNLKVFRKQGGFTQEDIAEKLGVSRQAVAKWERGETVPDVEMCIALAELYGTTVDALVRITTEEGDDGSRHIFGVAKVNDKGQITLPKKCREIFGIGAGDSILVLGDEARGIALINMGKNE